MISQPSPLGTIKPPSHDCADKAESMKISARITWERKFVARLMVDKKLIDDSLMIDMHLQSSDWWADQKLYHLYMFLLFFRSDREPDGWWKMMTDIGKQAIKEDSERGKLDGVGDALD